MSTFGMFTTALLFLSVIVCGDFAKPPIYKTCNPKVLTVGGHPQCPEGYCCVRDEYVAAETLCRAIGEVGDDCTTRPTQTACPCSTGLKCKPNVQSPAFTSIYGTCVNATEKVKDKQ